MPKHHAFHFLLDQDAGSAVDFLVAALYGNDSTLLSWTTTRLTGQADVTEVDGTTARWADIHDELCTASLFDLGEKRTLVIRSADKFVSANRPELESYVAKPGTAARLILQLDSLPSNTKLYKALAESQLVIQCSGETGKKTGVNATTRRKFLSSFVAGRHRCKISAGACELLIEMLGEDIGFLDTEIAKLALYLAPGESIDETLVHDVVAGWQGKTIWQITEAISAGNAAEAIKQLDRLMSGGQPAIALLPQIAWSLRRLGLATASHLHAERSGRHQRLEDSLSKAGIDRPHEVTRAISDLKRMRRERAGQLLPNLLDADLRLKGTHSSDGRDRFLLEHFVLQLAAE